MAEHGKFVMDNLYSKIGEHYQWGPNQRGNISHIDSIGQFVAINSDAELSSLFDANLLERQINLFVNIEDNMNEIVDGEHVEVGQVVVVNMKRNGKLWIMNIKRKSKLWMVNMYKKGKL
ncbi:hypothetical protein E2562_007561 [Oryza meyeriana var. granulata]|uniref:S1 motif domain-containing protein n=1 Tax=Oryza meyeriana var. granulata TaxID=110450 RepID=A0A6G1DVI3_9ORYZ|nr:hypothetical protein E2562_007561 [Oryza meyeriana var. granulata]